MKRLIASLFCLVTVASCSSTAPANSPNDTARPSIVVTYSVLGALVSELVGDAATVSVIIPDGQDPHDFEPSAKDIETINEATLVVSNGLDFEEGLIESLTAAEERGVAHFMVTGHLTTREGGIHSHEEDGDSHTAGTDPHVWLSPHAMSEMIDDLARAIQDALAIDVTAELNAVVSNLEALDVAVADRIKGLDSCTLVTGHDELGYFAERYGCTIVGAVIPSFSTTAEASAGELADLEALVRDYDVPAIFTGIGTSSDVVEMLSSTLGVPAIELSTHYMSGVSTYEEFITRLVDQIVGGLS